MVAVLFRRSCSSRRDAVEEIGVPGVYPVFSRLLGVVHQKFLRTGSGTRFSASRREKMYFC